MAVQNKKKGLLLAAGSSAVIAAVCVGIAGGSLGGFTAALQTNDISSEARTLGLSMKLGDSLAAAGIASADTATPAEGTKVATLATADGDRILTDIYPGATWDKYFVFENVSTDANSLAGDLTMSFGAAAATAPAAPSTKTAADVLTAITYSIDIDTNNDGDFDDVLEVGAGGTGDLSTIDAAVHALKSGMASGETLNVRVHTEFMGDDTYSGAAAEITGGMTVSLAQGVTTNNVKKVVAPAPSGFQTPNTPVAWGSVDSTTPIDVSSGSDLREWDGFPTTDPDFLAPATSWQISVDGGVWATYYAGAPISSSIYLGADPWAFLFVNATDEASLGITSGGVASLTSGQQFQLKSPAGYYTPIFTIA